MKFKISLTTILITLILVLAAVLRLYNIGKYMTFLGDEGRDSLVALGILQGHFTLLGPRASAGNFFTGPIYYYMMAPFLWLFHLNPVGPAVMVAIFGIATVYLIYYIGNEFFDKITGLSAAALYAISPLVITYSHSSWNPNTVPFFSLLTLYILYKAVTNSKSWKYYLLVGLLLGICIQLHYISLFLAVIVAVSLILMHWFLNKKLLLVPLILNYLEIFLGFLIGFSPFILFEVRHGFPNTKTIIQFITSDTTSHSYATYSSFYQPVTDVFFRLFGRLIFNYPSSVDYKNYSMQFLQIFGLIVLVSAIASIVVLLLHKNKYVVILLGTWLVLGVLLFGLYKKPIYDYYLVFIFPLPFFLIGNLISKIGKLRKKKIRYGYIISGLLFVGIFAYNMYYQPLQYAPNNQKGQADEVATFILQQINNQPFNFALLSTGSGNSDYAYVYYLTILGHPPVTINPQSMDPKRLTVTNQLIVVCEYANCKPLGNPLWEIAGFGQATILKSWSLSVVKVFKLVHFNSHSIS